MVLSLPPLSSLSNFCFRISRLSQRVLKMSDSEKDIARAEKAPESLGDGSSKEGANIVTGEVLQHREQTTERGLKSRHAQMIALGGMAASETGFSQCARC